MDLLQVFFLALIQGITEFLPISSSAHLILPSLILGWPDQGLAFDTSVHLGSLLAVTGYFRRDITRLGGSVMMAARTGQMDADSRFAVNLVIASLPILPVGFLLRFDIEQHLRSIDVIIVATLVFGVLLYLADRFGKKKFNDTSLTCKQSILIGLSQCLALIPGTSRSGITMTSALLAGFDRQGAARISLLISIPTIAGAATLKIFDLLAATDPVDWSNLFIASTLAMISAYLCIKLFLDFITRIGFLPFVLYRFFLGGLLLTLI